MTSYGLKVVPRAGSQDKFTRWSLRERDSGCRAPDHVKSLNSPHQFQSNHFITYFRVLLRQRTGNNWNLWISPNITYNMCFVLIDWITRVTYPIEYINYSTPVYTYFKVHAEEKHPNYDILKAMPIPLSIKFTLVSDIHRWKRQKSWMPVSNVKPIESGIGIALPASS